MATIKIRYLVKKKGAPGAPPRWFWQPPAGARAGDLAPCRVPADWAELADPAALEAAAIAAARDLNAALDAARAAAPLPARLRPADVPAGQRSLGELVTLYRRSADFRDLRGSTQRGYEQALARLLAWAGDAPVRAVGAKRIQILKASLAATPSMANAVIRVLRLVLEFGCREGWLQVNPARRPKLVSTDPSGRIWPRDAVEAFAAMADRLGYHSLGTAVILDEWIGQRQGDVLRLPRLIYRAGTLTLRQSKTGAGVSLPVSMVPALSTRLDAELERLRAREAAGAPAPSTLIVSEATGRPYKADHFRHAFAEVRTALAAEVPFFEVDYLVPGRDVEDPNAFRLATAELWFMHLRHTAVVRLAEAECDIPLIAAVTGHSQRSVVQILERYMVRTRKLARLAFSKRLAAEGTLPAIEGRKDANG